MLQESIAYVFWLIRKSIIPLHLEKRREKSSLLMPTAHVNGTLWQQLSVCPSLNPSSVLLSPSLSYCSFPSSPSAQSIVFNHIAAHICCSFTMPQTLFQEIYMYSFNSHNHPRKWIPLPPFKVV